MTNGAERLEDLLLCCVECNAHFDLEGDCHAG